MKKKHAEVIKAWADGAAIQYRSQESAGKWVDTECPAFVDDYEYRVKPAREYPTTRMTREELVEVVRSASGGFSDSYASLVNAGLRHAIDAGQVVTREEFDRAIGDRAARDLAVAIAVRDEAIKLAHGPYKTAFRENLSWSQQLIERLTAIHLFPIIDKVQA